MKSVTRSFSEITDSLSSLEGIVPLVRLGTKRYSAWPAIKNFLFQKCSGDMIKARNNQPLDLLSRQGIFYFLISIVNFLRLIWGRGRSRKIILTASSGLLVHEMQLIDSYSALKLSSSQNIFFINCNNIENFSRFKSEIFKNCIIVDNYSLGILSRIFGLTVKSVCGFFPTMFFNNSYLIDSVSVLKEHGFNVEKKELSDVIVKFLSEYFIYRIVFNLLRPKEALIVSAFSKSGICAALKHCGVSVTELQHGIVGRTHHGYNYRPHLKLSTPEMPMPDSIAVYNSFWKEELCLPGFFKREQVFISGRLKYDIATEPIGLPGLKKEQYVIFTGQAAFYVEIAGFVNSLIALCKEMDLALTFAYRPHPKESIEDINRLCKLIDSNMNFVVIGNELDITTEQLIYNSKLHLSIFSACHFDAIHFKGRSFVLDTGVAGAIDYFINKYKGDKFVIVCSADDLVKFLC